MLSAALILTMVLAQAAASSEDVITELTQFEHRLAAAYKKGDCAAWGAMLAPDWSVIHITGEVVTKDRALETCPTSSATIETMAIDQITVRQFGDAAVVTGRTRIATKAPNVVQITLRFTDVFSRRSGRWLVVASHATRLTP
jgi:ketosteroid isomerase-like protein